MSTWGGELYGDPCRDCGYEWSISQSDAVSLVLGLPENYHDLLSGADGRERHRELSWSVAGYVLHVADTLRIWAERLAGIALGAPSTVAGYDENLLAQARAHEAIALEGALWSLDRAVGDWAEAVRLAIEKLVGARPPRAWRADRSRCCRVQCPRRVPPPVGHRAVVGGRREVTGLGSFPQAANRPRE